MNFVVDYASLAKLSIKLNNNYTGWQSNLIRLEKGVNQIIESAYLQGIGANGLKQYMTDIHLHIIAALMTICEIHKNNYATYYKAYNDIDFDVKTGKILSAELQEINDNIEQTKGNMYNIDIDICSVLRSISDIFAVRKQNISEVIDVHKAITDRINDLEKKIRDTESGHSKGDFIITDNLIKSLKSFIVELLSKGRNYKRTYVNGSVSKMSSWTSFNTAAVNAIDYAVEKEATYAEAIQVQEKAVADYVNYEEEQRKEREKNASIIKGVVWGLGVVASVAAIVATGGAAAPLVMGAVGGLTAAANTATEKLTDAYVEDGDLSNVKWGDVGKDVFISGATGFITGYVGGKIGGKISGSVKGVKIFEKGLQSGNTIVRTVTSGTVDALSGMVTGGMNRGISSGVNEIVEMGVGIKDGEINIGNFGEAIAGSTKDILGNVFNPEEICKDVAGGFISGSVDEIIDTGVKAVHLDHKGLNNNSKFIRGVTGFGIEGTKEMTSGIGQRFTESLIEGEGFQRAGENALDIKEIGKDFIEGGAKEEAKYYVGKPVGDEVSLEDLKDKNILNKIPTDKVKDPKNWLENGGKIYIDSEGQTTFEAKKMKIRNTIWKEPKDKLFYDDSGSVNYNRSTIDETQKVVGGHFTSSKNSRK